MNLTHRISQRIESWSYTSQRTVCLDTFDKVHITGVRNGLEMT